MPWLSATIRCAAAAPSASLKQDEGLGGVRGRADVRPLRLGREVVLPRCAACSSSARDSSVIEVDAGRLVGGHTGLGRSEEVVADEVEQGALVLGVGLERGLGVLDLLVVLRAARAVAATEPDRVEDPAADVAADAEADEADEEDEGEEAEDDLDDAPALAALEIEEHRGGG